MSEKFICVHGHFYQPPRENPWLEAIEIQDSAYPYHDWNDRITAECYRPNAFARILDGEDRITEIVNNYSKISFNFGPTLLGWLEEKASDVYQAILEADQLSRQRFSGHGSAMAQVYNHLIMPLADRRDKQTQVLWGIEDFKSRFGRQPEGMWLAETAVDLETLDILVDAGIRFTVLSPYQAGRVRMLEDEEWQDARGGHIDPTIPYRQELPSGRDIALFFYDGPISQAIAFERLLRRGEDFASRLLSAFSNSRTWDQLVHVATDGETFGHHHRYGEMGLAYALRCIDENKEVKLTNYGEFLDRFEEMPEVEVVEDTSWSCVHGLERWRSDCGCSSGRNGWNQKWREPLRKSLNWLRDSLREAFERKGKAIFHDPWQARDEYISVILNRSPDNVDAFLETQCREDVSSSDVPRALKLMELQRQSMLMFTSCGWFFDDISGIETVQVLEYAGRALQLAHEALEDRDLESGFLDRLEKAKSNLSEHKDGKAIYQKWVKPAQVDLPKVGAHYGASSLFETYEQEAQVYCYGVEQEDYQQIVEGRLKLAAGRCRVMSTITREEARLSFAFVHLGDHNLVGGVRAYQGASTYLEMLEEIQEAVQRADLPEVIRRLDRHYSGSPYSLKTLFRDQQRNILRLILAAALKDAESAYRQIFEEYASLMRFVSEIGSPVPPPFRAAAETVLNAELQEELVNEKFESDRIGESLEEAETWQAKLDKAGLGFVLLHVIDERAENLLSNPGDEEKLATLEEAIDTALQLPFDVDLSAPQNACYRLLKRREKGGDGEFAATPEWVEHLQRVAEKLSIRVS